MRPQIQALTPSASREAGAPKAPGNGPAASGRGMRSATALHFWVKWPALWVCLMAALLALAPEAAGQRTKIRINDKFPIRGPNGVNLSPPNVEQTNECAKHVYVNGFVPHATIRVYLNGTTLIGGPVSPEFAFTAVTLTQALHTGDKITATQEVNGVTSAPSATMTVTPMPPNLPAPTIATPLYACAHVVGVHGLASGVSVEVLDATVNAIIGTFYTPNDWGSDWAPVVTSALVNGHKIKARQFSCKGAKGPYSAPQTVVPDPNPLVAPVLETPIVGNDAVTMSSLYTGAAIQAFDHAMPIGSGYATGDTNWMHVAPAISSSSLISAQQSLCKHGPRSNPVTPTTNLPAPTLLGPICPGQGAAYVADSTINAVLVLLVNGQIAGYGGAAPGDVPLDLAPPHTFAQNDKVQVVEYIGSLVVYSNEIIVGCTHVTTYHNDNNRTGWNRAENTLTTANVNPLTFGHIVTVPLDDQVDTQPLVVPNQLITGQGTHTVVYVTTESNSVYAIDSWTGAILKQVNLGPPVAMPQGCNNNGPNVGINGTGTIDLKTRTLYVIAYTTKAGNPIHQLHALSLETLADRPGSPVTVGASQSSPAVSFQSAYQRQRPALLEANGNIYAGFGSYCDLVASKTRGWVLGWTTGSLAALSNFELTNQIGSLSGSSASVDCTWTGNHPCFLSSVWMSGYGLAGDSEGNVYFNTGNTAEGTYNDPQNIGESVVQLPGSLSGTLHLFTPHNHDTLDNQDNDLGSGGAMVLPDQPGNFPHLLISDGKDGNLWVINRDNMGGLATPDVPQSVSIGGCWCGPSYLDTPGGGEVVSSGGTYDNNTQLSYNKVQLWTITTTGSPAAPAVSLVASSATFEPTGHDPGFFTSVSSDGTDPKTQIIWAVNRASGDDNHVTMYAFNATPSGATLPLLWQGVAGYWPSVDANNNIVPTVANGRVYVATYQQLQIFGLRTLRIHWPPRFTGEFEETRLREARVRRPPASPQFWGRVKSVEGDKMVITLRGGRELAVDLSEAIKTQHAVLLRPGQSALVRGTMGAGGVFHATVVLRAKGESLWGEDKEK